MDPVLLTQILLLLVVIFSIIAHELGHGYAAQWLGDPTARLAGRLTMNPLRHVDAVGTVILPLALFLLSAPFLFGWAKPVPYNPYNLRNARWGEAIVAAAGPLTNLLLAAIFGAIIAFGIESGASEAFISMAIQIVTINVLLALFNSIPFPPLDGSKVIVPFLPLAAQIRYRSFATYIENMGFLAIFLSIFLFMQIFYTPFYHLVLLVRDFFIWTL